MRTEASYPYILKDLLKENRYENIVDSNMLTPYIPENTSIPAIKDPRRTQNLESNGGLRYPGYVKSSQINQIFNYIGFIKRMNKREYAVYLPMLFKELNRFIRVVEEIVYAPCISISSEIYTELNEGLQNFFDAYYSRKRNHEDWIEEIWKYQKIYLDNIDAFLKSLEFTGRVFDLRSSPLHGEIVGFCQTHFHDESRDPPNTTDIHFVANCCTKAAMDNEPKTIWSGDRHITRLLKAIYQRSSLYRQFPQIYLRASYMPLHFNQLFPEPKPGDDPHRRAPSS
ncbi:MAG: hypothetical protein KGY61_13700 [Desulfobacterales bacterium]|nr:hypothetical protein [Desulfobacterales bacterium]